MEGRGAACFDPTPLHLARSHRSFPLALHLPTSAGVHGWGIFARRSIPQDTPIFEYRGDYIRAVLADLRETRYRREGRDCYLFRLNDAAVLDATTMGSISRFTNHCCQPSLYTRVRVRDGSRGPGVLREGGNKTQTATLPSSSPRLPISSLSSRISAHRLPL